VDVRGFWVGRRSFSVGIGFFFRSRSRPQPSHKQKKNHHSVAGPEFVLTAAEPPHLFIIARRWRPESASATSPPPQPQAAFYILAGSVYQAPPLGSILASRLDRCLWTIKAAFARMQADLDPLAGAERAAEAAAAAVAAAEDGGAPAEDAAMTTTTTTPATRRAPPPRRYTESERARMATADRVIAHVLGMVDGDKVAASAKEEGVDAAPAPMAVEGPA
jgi:hypothetical protein